MNLKQTSDWQNFIQIESNLLITKNVRSWLLEDGPITKRIKSNGKFRLSLKKMNTLIDKKDKKEALSYLPKLNSELMKIAKTGVIKKQNASRNISRLTRKINSL